MEIVFVGTPGQKWHGIDKIVYLANKLPENKFHIIGPEKEDISQLNLKIDNNIIFHGYLDQIKLENIAISVSASEASDNLIVWNGKEYEWIHTGD